MSKKIRKGITGVIAAVVVITLILIPKSVYIEFNSPKLPDELIKKFGNISTTKITISVEGQNYTGGGKVDSLNELEPLLNSFELENGNIIGISAMEFNTTGSDLLYIMTHKSVYDVANIDVFNVMLGKLEDQVERLIF